MSSAIVSARHRTYYAVTFTSLLNLRMAPAYKEAAQRMMKLAAEQPGYLGIESVRGSDGIGITISYWENEESIQAWKNHADHLAIQKLGKEEWYGSYTLRICKVLRDESHFNFAALSNLPPLPKLESERLFIVPAHTVLPQSALDFYLRNKAHFASTEPERPLGFYDVEFWKEALPRFEDDFLQEKHQRFFLIPKSDPARVIGSANLTQIFRGPFQCAYLGYSLDKDFQGQNLMFEALVEVLDYCFYGLKLHRVMANHLKDNHRSAKLLARLGFSVEGIAKNYLFVQDRWQDHVLTSLIHPENIDPPKPR